MLQSYFKVAIRSLKINKLYSFINIFGLTVGMTCFILIALFVQYEMSYDKHFKNADRIYRIYQQQKGNEFRGTDLFNVAPKAMAPTLRKEFHEVESASTIQLGSAVMRLNEKNFEQSGLYADEYLFDVFDFEVIEGEGRSALLDPSSILLTESLSKKFFKNESPVGKTIIYDQEKSLTVKGVIADAPKNQHFTYSFIASLSLLPYFDQDDFSTWTSNNYKSYVLLKHDSDPRALEKRFKEYESAVESAFTELNLPIKVKYLLQPILDIHLHSKMNSEIGVNGDIEYIYLLIIIGFIILFLACTNYMNLETARSAKRAREVGMRKVLGASRKQLVYQMLGESFMVSSMGFIFAVLLASALLPSFNEFIDKEIPFHFIGNKWLLSTMLISAVLVGGMSGLYPAVFISAVSPVKAFSGDILSRIKSGFSLRNILVVGQFVTAIVLAIGSLVIFHQLQYTQTKKLGYNRDSVVYVAFEGEDTDSKSDLIHRELLLDPSIEKVSMVRVLPLNSYNQGIISEWEGNTTQEDLHIYRNYVDHNFLDLFEIKLVEGRNFDPERATDKSEGYILNESAVKALGWKTAVGKTFNDGVVIGVVEDFHFQPFDLSIEPLFIRDLSQRYGSYINIAMKVHPEGIDQTMSSIKEKMSVIFPNTIFEPRFMDNDYDMLYRSERQFGKIFTIFTTIALFIACMGLLGLVSHSVLQRTKEIGIRKVLGASALSIVKLLSVEFVKLVILAILIATPLAYYLMNRWLQNFSYHIEMSWWTFAFAGICAIGLAVMTTCLQSIGAAMANPIESLSDE